MAISANSVYEVRSAGNDTNGGGFVTAASGSDWSQQDSKRTGADVTDISTTDAVANGTTTITSATANFATTIIGNIIYLQGGTGALAATRRQVTARASATSITVDATVAAGTGITMNIGGALATPGEASRVSASGMTVWIKAGTYTQTTSTVSTSGGGLSVAGRVYGYETTRGDFTSTRPLLQTNGVITSFNMISINNGNVRGINFDGGNRTTSRGVIGSSQCVVMDCNFANFLGNGCNNGSGITINCKATGCSSSTAFSGLVFFNCVAHDNTVTGITLSTGGVADRCIADTNTGATTDGISGGSGATITNCIAYNNGRNGISVVGQSGVINCIAEANTTTGIIISSSSPDTILSNNATYNNGTSINIGSGKGNYNINQVTLTGSPFTNAGSRDFSLNNTASAGAACRAAGIPGLTPDGLTTGYLDIGYAQHQDTGGGGGGEHSAVF